MNPVSSQRVFVGIQATEEIAEACVKLQASCGDLPARFIPPEDIHLTLLPPWEMTNQSFVEQTLRQALQFTRPFTLTLNRLAYGPNNVHPRLIWIECEASAELIALKKSLLKAFGAKDHVPFSPHFTIARFSDKDRELIRHRPIERPIALSMAVTSVELFASPHRGGKGYRVLASVPIPSLQ